MTEKEKFEYGNKVYKLLDEMNPGDFFTIKRICKEENIELFIEMVEEYRHILPHWGGIYFLKKNSIITKMYDVNVNKELVINNEKL